MLSDADGVPLVVQTTPANVRDEVQLPKLLEARPSVQGPLGRPRRNPGAIIGDRAYGTKEMIGLMIAMHIYSFLAVRTSKTHGSGLGQLRYVIERTLACFSHFRRLRLCYERDAVHWQAMHDLAASLLVCSRLKRYQLQF